jgi:hypothetical protein
MGALSDKILASSAHALFVAPEQVKRSGSVFGGPA